MIQNFGKPKIFNDIGAIQFLQIPVNRPDIRFCSYLRTLPLSHPASSAFQKVIYANFHQVGQVELDALEDLLEGMSDSSAFQILDSSTSYVNSRRVLTIRGRWLKMHEETVICIVDVKGDGLCVQQIYFTAPQSVFDKYTETANDIFLSIKWKHATD
jgi:hypothetical protein